jgi:hypothetical protein
VILTLSSEIRKPSIAELFFCLVPIREGNDEYCPMAEEKIARRALV